MAETTLTVTGMTCASCVRRVEKALGKVPGVSRAEVNLATEQATVGYDAAVADEKGLIQAIERAGYGVLLQESVEDRHDGELAALRHRWTVSLAIGIAMMAAMYLSLPLPSWLQLAAASLVQFWAGAVFYRTAWAAARHGSANMSTLVAVGSSVAYATSAAVTLFPQAGLPHQLYFESSVFIIALILLGRWLEVRARRQTSSAISRLMELAPRQARVLRDGV
ncbi:MAG: cation transporter, partial [Candidatus Eremiobacterota bacterium]